MTTLGKPFNRIFETPKQAQAAFELLHETAHGLDIPGPYDPRLAVTCSARAVHLDFGGWLILRFQAEARVSIVFINSLVHLDSHFEMETFAQPPDEPQVCRYELPFARLNPLEAGLQAAYQQTLDFIAHKFAHWQRTPYWQSHQTELAEAIFQPGKRAELLTEGLPQNKLEPERHYTVFEDSASYGTATSPPPPNRPGYFTAETFAFLEQLHQTPTKDFYMAHKERFQQHVQEPFQSLLHDVVEILPGEMTAMLETKRWLFSSIPKNDFGHGGAWDFYWGALYPKKGKRTTEAQLTPLINHQKLEWGFYIGEYGEQQRRRFQKNCEQYYEALSELLAVALSDERFLFGDRSNFTVTADTVVADQEITWQQWLQNPQAYNFRVSSILPKAQVLQTTQAELRRHIRDDFIRLFPLVLLATEAEPLSSITEYLSAIELVPQTETEQAMLNYKNSISYQNNINPEYPVSQLISDTFMTEFEIRRWLRAWRRKKQMVLQGPPGTGKTFIVRKLAEHLVGGRDGVCEMVQFHPAYSYEDFMQGLRPRTTAHGQLNYHMEPGRFMNFCQQASQRQGPCVFIIDEINRTNLSAVFGELMYLLEYRANSIPLAGGGRFSLPDNVYLIGTMNTADRSIALVDHALRRRFAFVTVQPNMVVLRQYHLHHETNFPTAKLINLLNRLNQLIDDPNYALGITYFLDENLTEHLADIWQMEVEPYLEERFFGQWDKLEQFRWENIEPDILGEEGEGRL